MYRNLQATYQLYIVDLYMCGTFVIVIVTMKTWLYNFWPSETPLVWKKMGFTGVYIIFFLVLLKNIDCG